jgi:hypothetical protein
MFSVQLRVAAQIDGIETGGQEYGAEIFGNGLRLGVEPDRIRRTYGNAVPAFGTGVGKNGVKIGQGALEFLVDRLALAQALVEAA